MSENHFPQLTRFDQSVLPREAHASACGKAIIVGEHAVVYGTRAVAIPLASMQFQFSLSPLPTYEGKVAQIQLKMAGHEVSPRVQSVVLDAMHMLELTPFSLHAKGHSLLPIGAGLGSSATLCVAVLRALSMSCDMHLPKAQLARYANELEKRFHGNPSGLDTAVVAYEQSVLFAKNQPIQPIAVQNDETDSSWEFVLIDSHVRASTMAMIRIAEPYFTGIDGDRHLARFDALSEQVHKGLQMGDQKAVGRGMHECDGLLRAAGVVPDSMAEMIDYCQRLGVLGAKTTGAGGGGMILALLDPTRAAQQLSQLKADFAAHPLYRIKL